MIKLAKFQISSKVFAGLSIPYSDEKKKKRNSKETKRKIAVLGGGDLGFPLLFAGVVMIQLMTLHDMTTGLLLSFIIPLTTSMALLTLMIKGSPNKFYPAMPFLSIGCFAGFFILKILSFL